MVGDIYRLGFKQAVYGVSCVNVLFYKVTADPAGDTALALMSGFNTTVIPFYQGALSEHWSGLCLEAQRVQPVGGIPNMDVLPPTIGFKPGEAMPPNAVAVISEYSATFTRAGRGRHFISGMREVDEVDNAWHEPAFVLLKALGDALADPLAGNPDGNFERVIFGGTPPSAKSVLKFEAHAQVRKLRRRTMKLC